MIMMVIVPMVIMIRFDDEECYWGLVEYMSKTKLISEITF